MSTAVACPHCNAEVARGSGEKVKIRTSIVVLHKSGGVEINCPTCRRGILIPVTFTDAPVRKAERFVISKS
jgi:ssDNA-binding Zn-finger/Zn-ribbon topoisomerase 1